MSGKVRNLGRGDECRDKVRQEAQCRCGTRAESIHDGADLFDIDAWVAMLEEQRLRIAKAAGVEPSQVSFQLGH